jgi:hypothetical protein
MLGNWETALASRRPELYAPLPRAVPTAPRIPSLLEVAGHITAPVITAAEPRTLHDLLGIPYIVTPSASASPTIRTAAGPGGDAWPSFPQWVAEHPFRAFGIGALVIWLLLGRRGR